MRPLRLELTAFGPFAGTELVDFAALAPSGLFLVHGDTGSGKTSVLDALCFALYGCVPGARDRVRDVRSDHADPAVLTSVQLDFVVAGEPFRIWRQPRQEASKRRGNGFTVHQPKALLFRGEGLELVSGRLDEVGLAMQDLLGMTADQFCQVVLLPQGEFARFLRADAKDRQDLLERLFAAQRYRGIEGVLAADKALASAHLGELATRADRLLHQSAAEVDQVAPPQAADPAWVATITTTMTADAASAAAAALAAAEEEFGARERHAVASARAAAQARLIAAHERRDSLLALREQRAEQSDQLRAARRAAPVVPVIERAAASAATAVESAEIAAAAIAAAGLETGSPAALTDRSRQLRAVAAELRATAPLEYQLAQADRATLELVRQLTAQEAARCVAASRLDVVRRLRAEGEQALQAAKTAAGSVADCAAAVERLSAQYAAAGALPAARASLLAARELQVRWEEACNTSRARQLALFAQRLQGMAGELAVSLAAGEPCAVCGSADHPAPASSGPLVSAADEDAAQLQCQEAADRAAAGRRHVELLSGEERRLTQACGDLAPATVEGQLLAARARLREFEALITAAEGHATAHAKAVAEASQLEAALSSLAAQMATDQGRLQSLQESIAAGQPALAEARAGYPTVAARLAAVQADAEASERAAVAAQDCRRAEQTSAADAATAVLAAQAAGFDGVAAAALAVRDDATCARLEQSCADHDRNEALVAAELADPSLQIELEPRVDVMESLRALDEATAASRSAQSRADDLSRRAQRLARLRRQLDELHAELDPARAAYDEIAGLADLTAGANPLRMRLSAYVLAARLEQVAAAASSRLATMTDGRYTLVHSDEITDGRKKSGLGLRVSDRWTGTSRDASSLSGGETFMASLALALALADVVREEAGGAQIDCLFVDEGFGSLDDSTLDEVMDVLDQLRDGGRLVGLVSHVAELRQRIPTQVRILKSANGSRVELSTELPLVSAAIS